MKSLIIFFGAVFFILNSCSNQNETKYSPPQASGLSGQKLAEKYCSSCHSFPNPSFLPKSVWLNGVLPKMALRFGLGNRMNELMTYSSEEIVNILTSNVYPDRPLIAEADWVKIVDYYGANSPEILTNFKTHLTSELNLFESRSIKLNVNEVIMTFFDKSRNSILISDNSKKVCYQVDSNLTLKNSLYNGSSIVAHNSSGGFYLDIGSVNPSELAKGRLLDSLGNVIIDGLHRPVNLEIGDVNEDGTDDFIISSFGNLTGSLEWYDGISLKRNLLLNEPGSRVVYFLDFDNDGKKDIVTLMTQGRERILLFKNKGKGRFEMNTLLEFPPFYGSSYLEIMDLDADGKLDLIYTNGDNADYSIVKKPYHGLRIFMRDSHSKYVEKYFYSINGSSKVISKDFDQDGDLDFAVISFFPDIIKKEGFLYFEQLGNLDFKVKSLNNVSDQKWLTIESGDIDNDGDLDILLGSYNPRSIKGPGINILINKLNNISDK